MRTRKFKKTQSGEETVSTPEQIRAHTFQRAAKLLAAKPHSIAELRERLLERFESRGEIEGDRIPDEQHSQITRSRFARRAISGGEPGSGLRRRRVSKSAIYGRP